MRIRWLQKLSIYLGIVYGIFYLFSIYKHITVFKLDKLVSCAALLLSIFIPFLLSKFINKKGIELSYLFHIAFLSFIFLSCYLGTVCNYYKIYPWWDKMLHSSSGIFFSLLGIYIIRIFIVKKTIGYIKSPFLIASIAFYFSLTATTLWEVFEYGCDVLLKTNMTDHSLDDTMGDIIAGALGAFITCIVYYLITKTGNRRKSK